MNTKTPIFLTSLRLMVVVSCAISAGMMALISTVYKAGAEETPGPYSVRVYKTISETADPGIAHQGVSFRLRKVVDIDPTTEAGQKKLSEIDLRAAIRFPHIGGDRVEKTVLHNGQAVALFTGLSAGLYVVEELPYRNGDVAFSVTEPFVVAVPTVDHADVEVHTKHQPQILIKHVDQSTVTPHGVLQYAIDANVPLPDAHNQLYRFLFVDELVDGQELVTVTVRAYQATSLSLSDVPFDQTAESGVLLSHEVRNNDARVEIELDRVGLETLAQLRLHNPLITVRATLTVRVDDWYPERHVLTNKAYLYTDGRNPESDPNFSRAVESNTVRVLVTRTPSSFEPPLGESDTASYPQPGNTPSKNLRSALANTGSALTLIIGFGLLLLFVGWRLSRTHRPYIAKDNI
ncbi:hypothetical protein CMUST_12990 [Corynebacterium mustelae]|uniref:Fimbrial isopeptide formation D2 domain n=1 Tax=Corynebacterium mustelae TaxID=571915 RepID=A0A0G3H0F5_9CORY|nr:hypothetical protein [Corynebacterium mustelae]AKK06894.1 hypothetical protein CMUST_12990 [Corynebacterium mustelae]